VIKIFKEEIPRFTKVKKRQCFTSEVIVEERGILEINTHPMCNQGGIYFKKTLL
jgi:hypothetical protein